MDAKIDLENSGSTTFTELGTVEFSISREQTTQGKSAQQPSHLSKVCSQARATKNAERWYGLGGTDDEECEPNMVWTPERRGDPA